MIKKFLDFHFNKENYIALAALFMSVFIILFFHIENIYENSFLENIQLAALIGAFVYCFKVKKYKVFFHIVAIVLFLMFARELSYGRVFLPRPEGAGPDDIYPWSHYKYGWCVDYIVGLYIAIGAIYGIVKKVWIDVIEIIKTIKFPFWSFFGSFICVFAQILF